MQLTPQAPQVNAKGYILIDYHTGKVLAEGNADCYPRLAPTSQWDTAAAQGVLEGAGGEVLSLAGEVLTYEARESFLNPSFLALPQAAAWRDELVQLARALD